MKILGVLLLLICTILVCTISLSTADVDDPTLVTLPEGQIRGKTLLSPNENVYYAFQDIPYAAPPVGKLRFQAPVAPIKWDGVLNTTKNERMCFQSKEYLDISWLLQTEDCLLLNVYTPLIPGDSSQTPLAVLVWIHGGGFDNGAAVSYKPELFIDHNIVVVTINYRLGPLGFLTTEDAVIPGNIALRDQNFAIQWVKKNIGLFGGDPEKITIAGESAGGASVGLHIISPKNKGLFRGAIPQSGAGVSQWDHQDYARFYAFELARNLNPNFTSNDSQELLEFLQSVPAYDIHNNTITVSIGKETGLVEGDGLIWMPVMEDPSLEDAFLPGLLHENVKAGNINKVPILIGYNSEEQVYLMQDPSIPVARAKYFDNDVSNLIRSKFNMTKANKVTAGTKLRQIYTNGTFENDVGAVVKGTVQRKSFYAENKNWKRTSVKVVVDFRSGTRPNGAILKQSRKALWVVEIIELPLGKYISKANVHCWLLQRIFTTETQVIKTLGAPLPNKITYSGNHISFRTLISNKEVNLLHPVFDEFFTTPIIRHAQLQSNYTDVYLYQFSYKGNMGGLKDVEVAGVGGVGHAEDLAYLWDTRFTGSNPDDDTPEDRVTRQRLLTLWSNFVKYLNPTPEKDSLLDNVTWEKVSPNNLVYLNINNTLEMQKNPKKFLEWERIIDIYAIPPLANY